MCDDPFVSVYVFHLRFRCVCTCEAYGHFMVFFGFVKKLERNLLGGEGLGGSFIWFLGPFFRDRSFEDCSFCEVKTEGLIRGSDSLVGKGEEMGKGGECIYKLLYAKGIVYLGLLCIYIWFCD